MNHPTDEALLALSLGQLSEAELTPISTHLSDCPACCNRIDQLANDDRLLAQLQHIAVSQEEALVPLAQRRPAVRALRQSQEDWSATRIRGAFDIGMNARFNRPTAPRSSLGGMRRILLRDGKGEREQVVRPSSDAMPQKGTTGDRYQLFGEIARGGMGAVLRGRDLDLCRDLAFKVLLDKYANTPEGTERFVEEAQIGGQLQHSGVVPVYDIGRFGDRLFFTMKLVEGKTLAAMLDDRERTTDDQPRLLNIALKVSEALAYAHAKGVIHRDLKPSNVMVGDFGEVQVMDWGLAKVLADSGGQVESGGWRVQGVDYSSSTHNTPPSTLPGRETEAGSVLGTPAYMPPEQANGEISRLDRRADVFGLGAILCEILTGKPPYVGPSIEEVHRKAAGGDLADAHARLDGCGAHPELIILTKWCLSPMAINRPKDAQAVVDGLLAYQNGVQKRLQDAEREGAVALVRASEEGKRRKVQLALAVAVMALLLGGGAFAFWRNEQAQAGRERDARNAEAVAALLNQCEEALRANDTAKAAVALEAAKKRYAEGGAQEQAERLGRLDADLVLVRDLDAVDRLRWRATPSGSPLKAVAARTREAMRRFGADPDVVSVDEAAARVSASAARIRVVAALDRLLNQEKSAMVRALLRRVDPDSYRDAVRDAILAADSKTFWDLIDQATALEQPPEFVTFLAEVDRTPVEWRLQLLHAAVRRRPENLGLLMGLGHSYAIHKKLSDERRWWYQAAVAAAPANPDAYLGLGRALQDKGQVDAAIAYFQKVIELDPECANAYLNLGAILCDNKRDYKGAVAYFQKAIELDPKDAMAYSNLGNARREMDQVDDAITCYEKAIELNPEQADTHNNLGAVLASKGQFDKAIVHYKKAIGLESKFAGAHYNLGNALKNKGQVEEAIENYKKAVALKLDFAAAKTQLARAEQMAANRDKLVASTNRTYTPTTATECLDLARWCQAKKLPHTSARLYAAMFAVNGRHADNLKAGYRYSAACQAALAAAGQGDDAAKLDDMERTHLRQQTLAWLRAELALWAKQLETGKPADRTQVLQTLQQWQQNADLAILRDRAALAKLPAEEQEACNQLWANVEALLKQAKEKPN